MLDIEEYQCYNSCSTVMFWLYSLILSPLFVSGTWFLPASTVVGAGLYSVAMYGGLALFGAFLLYDTQKIMKRAEEHPAYATQPYDPINK